MYDTQSEFVSQLPLNGYLRTLDRYIYGTQSVFVSQLPLNILQNENTVFVIYIKFIYV